MGIKYQSYVGSVDDALPSLPSPAIGSVSLNTPVGNCIDHFGNIWLADTAHNRVLVFDGKFNKLLATFGSVGSGTQEFNMPFRLLPHPEKNWMYVSDIANTRIHILEYDKALLIRSIKRFGQGGRASLKGPNGLAFFDGKLCVADEFYEGEGGASRLVIFNEQGKWHSEIASISTEDEDIHLLWPQGLSTDAEGNLYIANTGFGSVVRCDWKGNGVPFASGKPYIDHLALARDVSVIKNKILIPGGANNAIAAFEMDGRHAGVISGFFSPIQVTQGKGKNELLITEPILAQLQRHRLDLTQVKGGVEVGTELIDSVGDERDGEGQLHFVTAATGHIDPKLANLPVEQQSWLESLWNKQIQTQESWFKLFQSEHTPALVSLTLNTQLEWMQRWQQTWMRILFNDSFDDPKELLWMVDAGNFQLQATETAQHDAARPASLPLLPGSLGVVAYRPKTRLPGQIDADLPMIIVGNYLTGIISVYQYDNAIGELIPYTVFGGMGDDKHQFNKPQGIAVDPVSNDIVIADSGNNRISRWKITELGTASQVSVFGKLGDESGEFHTPTDVTFDSEGHLFVTDQTNNRIEVFDQHNKWMSSFGQEGYGKANSNLLLPTSIEFDNGYLFVSDLVNRAIKVFDLKGQFVESFSGFGANPETGQLWMPYLLHVKNGVIYLPDCALNRINIYQYQFEEQGEQK
ncbi:NHL repeat-containing protein [Vibrio sonorensis]|uniref:NHL repeat-containing protein n=1 Tax=Vibrio sonorensis TaxID=1004316 RepID=UPI0008D9FF0A|nr:NHL repeat-containing protein [Vibrio sonorensis]